LSDNTTPPASGTSTDWVSLYSGVQQNAQIPGASGTKINQNDALFRDMYIDLSDVQTKLRASGFTPFSVTIYADVVHIPNALAWTLASSALTIAARRIEIDGQAQVILDFRKTQDAALVIFANEIAGSLLAAAATTGAPQSLNITTATAKGIQVGDSNGTLTQQTLAGTQGPMLQDGSDFQLSLVAIFQFATVLLETQPDIASAQLEWVKAASANSPQPLMVNLCLQSSAMQALLNSTTQAAAHGASFVPYLTQAVYTNLAQAYVAEAQDYETQYNRFSDKNEAIEARIAAAKIMLANSQDTTGYVDGLIQQCQNNLDQANASVFTARNNLQTQQDVVAGAKNVFNAGIEAYEREQKLQAAFQIVTSIFTFGASIGMMLVGDEAAGAGAAGSAVKGAEAVASAAKAGSEAAKTASSLASAMKQLLKMLDALNKTIDFAAKITAAAKSIQSAGGATPDIASMDISTGGTDITSSNYWQIFKLSADSALKDPIDKGIDGASNYQLQLDILTVYGQSLTACQVAVVNLSQEMVRLSLQKQVSVQQTARLTDFVNSMSASEEPNAAMMQIFYQLYLDSKRSLFVALKNYQLSYQYWALRPSTIKPSITNTVGQFNTSLNNLTKIAMDDANALSAFSPPPQILKQITYEITDPSVLQSLAKTSAASWPIALDEPAFAGLDRVRVSTVRIWLEGAKADGTKPINVQLSTSGSYRDRYKGTNYQFTSPPLQRVFQYHVTPQTQGTTPAWVFDNGQYGFVNVDATVDDMVSFAYFVPTAYSDWTIRLPANLNAGLDLSGVTKITMDFSGSVIEATQGSINKLANSSNTAA
jgi:hypothetical protein